MKRHQQLLAMTLGLTLMGCNLVTGPDLKAKAEKDVQVARALNKVLTITAADKGTTLPSGTVDIKDGIGLEIESSAQPEAVLVGWKQTGGDGKVTFEPLEGSLTKVRVTVLGGDATIEPVYELRPVLLYMTPIGNNIAKNSSVRLVFNREVDLGSGSSPLVTIKKQGVTEVPYTLSTKAGNTTVTLKPVAPSLDDYAQYVVTIEPGVPVKATFDDAHYPGVTFINKTVTSRSEVNSPFQTGANFDTLPPYGGAFTVESASGNTFYSSSPSVLLTHIQALDDSGDGGVASFAVRNNSDPFPDFPNEFVFDSSLNWTLAAANEGEYSVSMIFKDVNGNAVPTTSAFDRTFNIDTTAPTVNTFVLTSSANAPGYVNSTTTPFLLGALDPVIFGTSTLGSGESNDGTTAVELKQYRLSNANGAWSAWTPFSSSGSWQLSSGTDGGRSVTVQVQDGVGNVSAGTVATVTLDTTSPTVLPLLPDGTLITANAAVLLQIGATDSGSGLDTINVNSGSSVSGSITPIRSGVSGTALAGSAVAYADTLSFTLAGGDGSKHLDILVADRLGNTTTKGVDLLLDRVAPTQYPTLPHSTFVEGSTTGSATVNVNLSASDSGSGLAQVGWQTDEFNSLPGTSTGATWVAYQPTIPVVLSPQGSSQPEYVYLWFKDAAGNISAGETISITYSTLAPTGTLTLNSTSNNSSGNVNLSWTATAYSGKNVASIELSNDSSTWVQQSAAGTPTTSGSNTNWSLVSGGGGTSANGSRKVYMRITDSSSPTPLVTTKSVKLSYDNQAPTLSVPMVTSTSGTVATPSTTVSVSFTVSDNLTPVGSVTYEIADNAGFTGSAPSHISATAASSSISTSLTFSNSTNGTKTVYLKATDLAGNVATTQASIVFDNVAPTLTNSISLNGGAAFTTTSVISVSGIAFADVTSGVSKMRFANTDLSAAASSDSRWSAWMTPSASYANWDVASGYGGTASTGTKTLSVQVMDAAGNFSPVRLDAIVFDNVAPTASPPTAAATTVSSRLLVLTNVGVSDAGGSNVVSLQTWSNGKVSGLIASTGTGTFNVLLTPQNGAKSVYVRYVDGAGNYSSWYYIAITLSATWGNLTGRAEMVGSNYANPAANNHSSYPSAPVEDTSWLTTQFATPQPLAPATTGPRSLIFMTNSGRVGKLDYYLPAANQIQIFYTTYDSNDNPIQTTSPYWTTGTLTLVSGTAKYFDLDTAAWSPGASNVAGVTDMFIRNDGGTFNLYCYTPMKIALF